MKIKKYDSLTLVASNNRNNIHDEIPLIVEKNNSSAAEAESEILAILNNISIPILFENSNDTQDNDPTKTEGKIETDGNKNHSNTADPVTFRIDGVVDINGERNLDSTFSKKN